MNSLPYRKDRIVSLSQWGCSLQNPLFTEWKIPLDLWFDFQESVCRYIAKAMHFSYTENEYLFMKRVDEMRHNRLNVTPNGGIVPKREYQLEYNLFLKYWCEVVRTMTFKKPELLTKFRITPNVRIKFGEELEENVGRPLDTALPHSDAWAILETQFQTFLKMNFTQCMNQ